MIYLWNKGLHATCMHRSTCMCVFVYIWLVLFAYTCFWRWHSLSFTWYDLKSSHFVSLLWYRCIGPDDGRSHWFLRWPSWPAFLSPWFRCSLSLLSANYTQPSPPKVVPWFFFTMDLYRCVNLWVVQKLTTAIDAKRFLLCLKTTVIRFWASRNMIT